jgi:hypothetical protein
MSVHDSSQSTLLEGVVGINIAGDVSYPAVGSIAHRTGASCVACHMGEPTDGLDGSHSMKPAEKTCIVCHTSGAPTEVTDYTANMDALKNALAAKGVVTISSSGSPSLVKGTYPIKYVQAYWNYKFLDGDMSEGTHNPPYAKALLKNSIQALQ